MRFGDLLSMKAGVVVMAWLIQALLLGPCVEADEDVVPDSATHVKFDFAGWCKVGGHTFALEKTTLMDIVRTLGSGTIRGNGKDAGESEYGVEFLLGHDLVRFSSNAEMGGDDHLLDEIEVRPLVANDGQGRPLPRLHGAVTFTFGAVGMPFADLVAELGPAVRSKNVAWYDHVGTASTRDFTGKLLDGEVYSSLRIGLANGHVESIQLGRVTSY